MSSKNDEKKNNPKKTPSLQTIGQGNLALEVALTDGYLWQIDQNNDELIFEVDVTQTLQHKIIGSTVSVK